MSIIESQLDKFEEIVDQEFGFLKEFGFRRVELQKIDFEYPQDERVEINYFSDSLCVTVRWFLTYANLEVGLIELVNKRMPEKISFYGDSGYGRAISLYDLVELLTKEEDRVQRIGLIYDENIQKVWKSTSGIIRKK